MNPKLVSLLLYINYAQSANILGIFVLPTMSHQSVFQTIWKELSLKGHKVTVVTPNPLNNTTLTNLTEVSVSQVSEMLRTNKVNNIISKDGNIFWNLRVYALHRFVDVIVEMEINSTQIYKNIFGKNTNFDLILVESHYPLLLPLSTKFQAPIISVSSYGAMTPQKDIVGNPYHPILYPDPFITYHHKELPLSQKIESVLFVAWSVFHYEFCVNSRNQELAKKYFGKDIPFVGDLEKNMSLLYLNNNPLLTYFMPVVPAVVELGQIHLKSANALPKDLQQILDEAQDGVIYFSLGNSIKTSNLHRSLIKIITEALAELPYVVVWKWELDQLPEKPQNIIIRKWLPQQDLLAHPNVRAFVTQGGLQSIEEGISRGVPLVVMPLIFDQPMHMQRVVDLGIGVGVDPSTVTKEELRSSIIEVSKNSRWVTNVT